MLEPRIGRKVKASTRPKQVGVRSSKHLDLVRSLECPIYPGERPIEAHHLMKVDSRPKGGGRTNPDRWATPLSDKAHDELHVQWGNEEKYFAAMFIDGRSIARELWKISQAKGSDDEKHEKAMRVVERAHQWRMLKIEEAGRLAS